MTGPASVPGRPRNRAQRTSADTRPGHRVVASGPVDLPRRSARHGGPDGAHRLGIRLAVPSRRDCSKLDPGALGVDPSVLDASRARHPSTLVPTKEPS
jgi:hypothetical protein